MLGDSATTFWNSRISGGAEYSGGVQAFKSPVKKHLRSLWVTFLLTGCGVSPPSVPLESVESRSSSVDLVTTDRHDADLNPADCHEADSHQLFTALGDDAPTPRVGDELRTLHGQLDGEGCPEAVLVVRIEGDTFREHRYLNDTDGATDHVWVFRRVGGGWAPLGYAAFNASLDQGTFDYTPGVTSIRIEALGGGRGMLAVEEQQAQGSVDPRWSRVRKHWYAVADGQLREVLACNVSESNVNGPCRSGQHIQRELELNVGEVPTIHVRRTAYIVLDRDGECANNTNIEPEQRSDYRFVDGRFEPVGLDLCDWR